MKIIARNRRATFDYDITERYTAGIALLGSEVKSVKQGHVSLRGSFITVHGSELYLTNAHINPYTYAATEHEPTRSRKLLLHKREVKQIADQITTAGVTAVPLAIGLERGLVKLELGIGRGKKQYDKREVIKKRLMRREAERETKQHL